MPGLGSLLGGTAVLCVSSSTLNKSESLICESLPTGGGVAEPLELPMPGLGCLRGAVLVSSAALEGADLDRAVGGFFGASSRMSPRRSLIDSFPELTEGATAGDSERASLNPPIPERPISCSNLRRNSKSSSVSMVSGDIWGVSLPVPRRP
jgi:hypothetical protein